VHVLHGVICRVCSYVCEAHYVYVKLVEEKELGVCWVCQSIWCMYEIRTKAEVRID